MAERQGVIRYLAEIDEDQLENLADIRKAFKVLKKAIRDDKWKLKIYHTRNYRLTKENQLLKESIKRLSDSDCFPETALEESLQIVMNEKERTRATEQHIFSPKMVKPVRKITFGLLGKIICRLCFGQSPASCTVSVFTPFAEENFLCDIIQTCFGVHIDETDFCTEICHECLAKVDLTWKMYISFQSNCQALNEFYSSLKRKLITARSEFSEDEYDTKMDIKEEITAESRKRNIDKLPMTAPDQPDPNDTVEEEVNQVQDEEDNNYDLPEHPFFTEFTTSVYLCHLCSLRFDKAQALHIHLDSAHPVEEDEKLCHYCAKFVHPIRLKKHIKHHETPKPVCEVCQQTFGNSANLRRHMLIHTKERPYTCKLCEAAYNQSTLLKIHVRKVHQELGLPRKATSKAPKKGSRRVYDKVSNSDTTELSSF